eukprot:TRINITY_DN12276_c0_g1_i2.p1 TRINITY_DN12276_c0_g1~~TRINITY_DN12276_c0_g1_i2.p1  ORF type:complete len:799 (+),score=234.65 TRINITY_DN12276_c0_g1_i2:103-2499(+)
MAGAVRWVGGALMSAFDSADVTSGANDIIVVKHKTGELCSSPFNVRFGKLKVIRRSDKYIFIRVNGVRVQGLCMKLGSEGEAFWVAATQGAVPASAQTSPISSPLASPRMTRSASAGAPPSATPPSGRVGPAAEQCAPVPPPIELGPSRAEQSDRPRRRPRPIGSHEDLTEEAIMNDDWSDGSLETPLVFDQKAAEALANLPQVAEVAQLEESADAMLVQKDSILRELEERLQRVADQQEEVEGPKVLELAPTPSVPACAELPLSPTAGLHLAQSQEGGSPNRSPPAAEDTLFGGAPQSALNGPWAESGLNCGGQENGTCGDARRRPIPRLQTCLTLADESDDPTSMLTAVGDGRTPAVFVAPAEDGRNAAMFASAEDCEVEEPLTPQLSSDGDAEAASAGVGTPGGVGENVYAKTLYPTSAQLVQLGLQEGRNEITFVVHSALRGEQEVTCWAYLVEEDTQMVISDIDGTITRSDILGHLLPRVGKDWTHKGICSFYQRIRRNGYLIMYLSSRSISQIQGTRDYIFNIVQDNKRLPYGPVLMAPDRIFSALTREVLTRTPHEFKSRMLHYVKAAFPPGAVPFYAGFGNRINDAWAYQHVGVKGHKIFIIDTNSNIHVVDKRVRLNTYGSLDALADQAFPPAEVTQCAPPEYNAFLYWSLSPGMGLYEEPQTETPANPLNSSADFTTADAVSGPSAARVESSPRSPRASSPPAAPTAPVPVPHSQRPTSPAVQADSLPPTPVPEGQQSSGTPSPEDAYPVRSSPPAEQPEVQGWSWGGLLGRRSPPTAVTTTLRPADA